MKKRILLRKSTSETISHRVFFLSVPKMRFAYLIFVTLLVFSLAYADDETTTLGDEEATTLGDESEVYDNEMMNDDEVTDEEMSDPARRKLLRTGKNIFYIDRLLMDVPD